MKSELPTATKRIVRISEGVIIGAVGAALIYWPLMTLVFRICPVPLVGRNPLPYLARISTMCILSSGFLATFFWFIGELLGNVRGKATLVACGIAGFPAFVLGFWTLASLEPAARAVDTTVLFQVLPGIIQGAFVGAIAGMLFERQGF